MTAGRGGGDERRLAIEHPTGALTAVGTLDAAGAATRTAIVRTARKLMDDTV